MKIRIAPSILSANWGALEQSLRECERGGADLIHLDVMDGRFVPNLTFGAKMIETVRSITKVPLDVHMMVVEPESYFDSFAAAGANILTIHAEAAPHLDRQIMRIKELGCAAGVAINPGTSIDALREVVGIIDVALVMTVNPGFGGQSFIKHTLDKITRVKGMLRAASSRASVEVDGGINRQTIAACAAAGADTFVAGQALFGAADVAGEVRALHELALVAV